MMQRTVFFLLLLLAASCAFAAPPALAMKDPSAVYCEAMGYTYTVAGTLEGPLGVCVLPDGTKVGSFRFLQGLEGTRFSYCTREGYGQQVVTSYRTCGHFGLDQCLVCILPDGTQAEVTQLMNLSFAETRCGDGSCGMPENTITCPADCPTGGWDHLCDGIRDGRCDPDCPEGDGDPDCGSLAPELLYIAALVVLALAGAAIYLVLVRRKTA